MDTLLNRYWLPTLRAAIEINRHNPAKAIDLLQAAAPYELGEAPPLAGTLYPVYIRGQAYLLLHQSNEAAAEFQKFLDHRGIVTSFPLGALALLGLAHAYALQAGFDFAPGASPPVEARHVSRAEPRDAVPAATASKAPANALAKARTAYQDFLALWKDADPGIPVLIAAQSEYAKLK